MSKKLTIVPSHHTLDEGWFYTDIVKDHFFNPRNIFLSDEEAGTYKYDGVGMVGSPACGDMMKIWIKCDPENDRITECKWQTFGCASAIASTSMMSVMIPVSFTLLPKTSVPKSFQTAHLGAGSRQVNWPSV